MEFSEVLKKRRSTRKFTIEGVSREQIIKLLEAAIAAPNACNMQSWHFYVVTDLGMRNKLREECAVTDWATTAPVLFVVCADSAKITERFGERADKVFVVQDTAAAIENLLLCAADMGLGGCFMGAFNEDKIRTIVGVKNGHKPLAVVPVGVPAMEMPARPRNPLENVVTFIGDGAGEYTELDTSYRKFEVKNSCVAGAVFENAGLADSTFVNVNFDGSTFKNCSFKNVTLENCDK